jgi:hypothetical protein
MHCQHGLRELPHALIQACSQDGPVLAFSRNEGKVKPDCWYMRKPAELLREDRRAVVVVHVVQEGSRVNEESLQARLNTSL